MIDPIKNEKKKKAVVTFVIAFSVPAITEIIIAVGKICIFIYKNYPF